MMLKRKVYEQEHEMYRRSVRAFLEQEAVPHIEAWEKSGVVPLEVWRKLGENGLLCPHIPEEYGGPGGDYRYLAIVNEEAASLGVSAINFAVHSDIVASYILNAGTEEQKQEWLPRMVSGEIVGAIAMSEPDAGSDLQSLRCRAELEGDEYIINGSKTFISNGQNAGVTIVVAKTNPELRGKGISLFLVESDRPGFRKGRNLDKIGLKGQDTSELFFDNVRVPASNMLGGLNQGFGILMNELPRERLAIGVFAMASCQAALDMTIEYTRDRKAFGKSILDFQNTRFQLADLKTRIQAGWAMLDAAIEAHVADELEVVDAAMVKLFTSELQGEVMDTCLQLHGGYGYMNEYPIARMFLDARVQRIYGGTSEIMRELIGRSL